MNHTFTFYCLWALSVVKLCRPLGACHVVKIKIHLHVQSYMLLLLWKYASTYIHSFPSPDSPKIILLLSGREQPKRLSYPCYSLWINAQDILVTTTCYIIPEGWVLWKKKRKKYEKIKRGKCPKPRRKEKVRREVKMDKCPSVQLGVQDTHLREKKKKYTEHLIPLKNLQSARKVCIPSKEQK